MSSILIIEDEQVIAELERDYLVTNGYQVDIASDGERGLEMGLQGEYDLIILDLMLPHVSGFDICRQIREKRDIPILMVTAKKEDIDIIRGLGLGADDYITKPFKPLELVARVKAHLARYERLMTSKESKDIVAIRGLTLDHDARTVHVDGKEVILTNREFDLLYYLATNPNRVFSKDHLFEKLWGWDSVGDTQTVTVHIRKLREKIETDPAKPAYIETIWGAGYRLRQ
ncbi:response regulator transcription factor [Paenibacillus filicis]|uniref:Response regulator transcription factor n=1 Tax=Paenibacillus gyeongsangnamensis TaxID=3388067 RepID=A0ABT4Q5Z6_9BACL|nr:response regulator transcription factor [Paenibacillus filicis]MCZ8512226.1 response regulator transcription factor [Paenibacillus filicis]